MATHHSKRVRFTGSLGRIVEGESSEEGCDIAAAPLKETRTSKGKKTTSRAENRPENLQLALSKPESESANSSPTSSPSSSPTISTLHPPTFFVSTPEPVSVSSTRLLFAFPPQPYGKPDRVKGRQISVKQGWAIWRVQFLRGKGTVGEAEVRVPVKFSRRAPYCEVWRSGRVGVWFERY